MAHFAQLDENGVVTQVIVVHNNELINESGNESEAKGIAFCQSLFGANTRWVQTSYNGNFRKYYAGIGFTYDPIANEFVPPPLPPEIAAIIESQRKRFGSIPNDSSSETP